MFVSQKTLVINEENKLLALRRSDTDPSRPLTWDLPGGELEEGEDLEENARKEILEEAGIEVGELKIFDAVAGFNKDRVFWVHIGYITEVAMPEISLSYEHDQYLWLTKEEFLSLESSEKIKRFLGKLP